MTTFLSDDAPTSDYCLIFGAVARSISGASGEELSYALAILGVPPKPQSFRKKF